MPRISTTTVAKAAYLPDDPAALTPVQRETALAARAWWQEGERALDYLAERARHEAVFEQARTAVEALRFMPDSARIAALLLLARRVGQNRALNRTLETDAFAEAVRALLFGDSPLPVRLAAFLAETPGAGAQTASQLLYVAFPDRFPLVTERALAVLNPAPAQRTALRRAVAARFGLETAGDTIAETNAQSRAAVALLADFALWEATRDLLTVDSFADVDAILTHAREMPAPTRASKSRRSASVSLVRETPARNAYAVASANNGASDTGDTDPATETALLELIEGVAASHGFTFPPLAVRSYYVALKTKPFAILSGLSGTGKTRLTALLAEAITGRRAGHSDQYLLLPVRPDWTDGAPLLGYHNLLTDRYVSTPFLDLLRRAAQPENRDRAFFVCLDEMNLARVEHYFADILSAMETPDRLLRLSHADGVGETVPLGANVFLTGSVNVDEATYPFSRKVLDRANTLEFADVDLAGGMNRNGEPRAALPQIAPHERQRRFLAARTGDVRAAVTRLATLGDDFPDRVVRTLTELNDLLKERGLHFGYRVRDEALRFCANAFDAETGTGLLLPGDTRAANLDAALDLQVMQKALPRLAGTEETLARLLRDLEAWAKVTEGDDRPVLPRAAAKLARMRTRAADDGVVTFYEW